MEGKQVTEKKEIQIEFVDMPGVFETFSDSTHFVSFDGATMRIEFCVTRMDRTNPATAKRYPVCRLVFPANAGLEFYSKLHEMISDMEKNGAITKKPPPTGTPTIVQ
jgi:hypothetical protein